MRILACLPILGACGGGTPAVPDAPGVMLRAQGTAAVTEANERVECDFALDLTSIVEDGGGFTGEGSGEVFRRSFRDDALVFEFGALVAGSVSVTEDGGFVEARLVGDQPDDAKPFWISLEAIRGELTGPLTYEGNWTCMPILPGDPDTEDLELDAPGSWTIDPV